MKLIFLIQFLTLLCVFVTMVAAYLHARWAGLLANALSEGNSSLLKKISEMENLLERLEQKIDVAKIVVEARKEKEG